MSSDEYAIEVNGLGKRYEIYSSPRDRLKQFILPPLKKILNMQQSVYYKEHWALRDISLGIT